MQTIFALATAPGRSGVAVVRVSGPDAKKAIAQLAAIADPEPRKALLRRIVSLDGRLLDEGLVLWFPGPSSFTGEDVAEFQVHGSVAVVDVLLRELGKLEGFRSAEPGEFTRRALGNGKLDLTQVEGLADLIDAQTEAQRVQAQSVMSGKLSDVVEVFRTDLIRASGLLAAAIDFADEEVPTDVSEEVIGLIDGVLGRSKSLVAGQKIAERLRNGFEVALVGAPNVGKSTLLNALAGRDAAITSDLAGTTRDIVEVHMDIQGIPVTVMDTAGLRATNDPIENEGIKRTLTRAEAADMRVFLRNEGDELPIDLQHGDIEAIAKGDLTNTSDFAVSGKTGAGVEDLMDKIAVVLKQRLVKTDVATHLRHVEAFKQASYALIESRQLVMDGPDSYDVAAEEIRWALQRLDSVIGRVDVENVLDVVFSSFCIGK